MNICSCVFRVNNVESAGGFNSLVMIYIMFMANYDIYHKKWQQIPIYGEGN
jgi:hypothetical protein